MLVYIDTDSGNWGVGEGNLVVVDLDNEQIDALMDEMSESEIKDFGKRMNQEQNFPDWERHLDEHGQSFYTERDKPAT